MVLLAPTCGLTFRPPVTGGLYSVIRFSGPFRLDPLSYTPIRVTPFGGFWFAIGNTITFARNLGCRIFASVRNFLTQIDARATRSNHMAVDTGRSGGDELHSGVRVRISYQSPA